jgi:hypothetical protein
MPLKMPPLMPIRKEHGLPLRHRLTHHHRLLLA